MTRDLVTHLLSELAVRKWLARIVTMLVCCVYQALFFLPLLSCPMLTRHLPLMAVLTGVPCITFSDE